MKKEEKSFLIACCLADGCLYKDKKSNSVSLKITHSKKQKDYLEYKKEKIVKALGVEYINIRSFKNSYGTQCVSLEKGHKYFRVIRKWLYSNNKKTLSPFIMSKMTLEGLAIWWMDDGSMYNKFCPKTKKIKACEGILSTYCSKEENELVINWMSNNFNITPKLHFHKGKYRLRFNTKDCKNLQKLLDPFTIKSLKYKLLL